MSIRAHHAIRPGTRVQTDKVCEKHPELAGLRYRSNGYCIKCARERAHAYRKKVGYNKLRTARVKLKVMSELGGRCALCSENDMDVLTIDHIHGRTGKDRKQCSWQTYRKVHNEKYPKSKYRVLCFNCNIRAYIYRKRTGKVLRARSRSTPIPALQREIHDWANSVFPSRTAGGIILKLQEEVKELIDKPFDPLEYGDVVLLVLDLATVMGIDVYKATVDKITINKNRTWVIDTIRGTMQHLEKRKV